MSGSLLQMQFDKVMKDPTGKHGEFAVVKEGVAGLYQKWTGYPDTPVLTSTYPNQAIVKQTGSNYFILLCSSNPIYRSATTSLTMPPNNISYYLNGGVWQPWSNASTVAQIQDAITIPDNILLANQNIYTTYGTTDPQYILFAKNVGDGGNVSLTPVSISRNAIVTEMLELFLQESIAHGDTIKVSYTKGTIESNEGKLLESFSNVEVDNIEVPPVSPYQDWANYPDSPFLTSEYPYQCIITYSTITEVIGCSTQMNYDITAKDIYALAGSNSIGYYFTSVNPNVWLLNFEHPNTSAVRLGSDVLTFREANQNILNNDRVTVYFTKTTP